jgi:hypothetical protein
MKRLKILTIVLVGLAVSVICLSGTGRMQTRNDSANAGSFAVIGFETAQVTERVWFGAASGDVSGEVTLEALNRSPQFLRGTWAGQTRWQIVAGENSFVAVMNGKINSYNGVLLMNGRIVDGANPGAAVSAQGQVIAVNPHRFAGTIRVGQP